MKRFKSILFLASLILLLNFMTYAQKEVNKSFTAKETLKISTVSGDCTIKKGTSEKILVNLKYTYSDDCFEYIFNEGENYLKIEEDFHGNNCNGKSEWSISIPTNISVKFNSASGDLILNDIDNNLSANTASGDIEIKNVGKKVKISTASGNIKLENINGDSDISTASGDITAQNCKDGLNISAASGSIIAANVIGEINISTASGDIKLTGAKGEFSVKNASGNIEAENIELNEESYFSSASGNVEVILANSAAYNLTLSSASGNSVLDFNSNEIIGFFEFLARADKGEIISPIKFDKEEVIEKNGKDYDLKSFTKGNNSPIVKIKTASGKAELKK
ncbi:MAG: DUF4097 family beta strand repeat-containing protein [Bacteroidales bacterium]|jgi:DUF4097 and DUF4098 domain-containing protein YvlB|nr:DUF4097 family beta strand repeat-containing protein [Bacteroidales bacterium]